MRLDDYLIRNDFNRGDVVGLTDARRSLTFHELHGEARALADALDRRGVVPGDRVTVISRNRAEFVAAAFACFLGGYIFQPVNFRLSSSELIRILDDSQPSGAIVDGYAFPNHLETLAQRPDLRALGALTDLPGVYDFGDGPAAGLGDPNAFTIPEFRGSAAALLYTGGTTGTPKGTVLSHRAWVHSSRDGAYAMRLGRGDVTFQCIPLFHVAFVHYLSAFYLGVPAILSEQVRPAEIVDAITNRGATHTTLVQTAMVDLLNHIEDGGISVPRIASLQYGASPIAPSVIERVCDVFGDVLHQNYGSTEAGGAVTYLPPEDHNRELAGEKWHQRIMSAGYAMPGAQIGVFSPLGERLEPNEPGEVRVKSEAIMDGYWGNRKATDDVLTSDGWLITGDIGVLDRDGYLRIVDRKNDMIISGGENIYARDVEDALLAHPGVREAAVIGRPDNRLGEQVVAFVVLKPGVEAQGSSIRDWLEGRIASYKRPYEIFVEADLPRTTVGKIHKPTLRDKVK